MWGSCKQQPQLPKEPVYRSSPEFISAYQNSWRCNYYCCCLYPVLLMYLELSWPSVFSICGSKVDPSSGESDSSGLTAPAAERAAATNGSTQRPKLLLLRVDLQPLWLCLLSRLVVHIHCSGPFLLRLWPMEDSENRCSQLVCTVARIHSWG